ncbi:conserved hypothetical protein [Leishmania major strain Friedlin]|uniref:Uncharacterized protein n=1 Tax=Leishmania major TaxID=5664 RepID=E9ADS2_LEIMA|nr:conserved hypothetical protein [Leishmania major strain Friedlin]CAG9577799.1 hypothetical_protein_-_conserved [Leishmania major strain Friedlin]CBZ12401.1 conserved hypothetical protein [Leishmania major strain Friedlin]|eukprot:XP_003722144.1 conserved hypothetical protein [Leishmania major strain Friedlin]
MTSSLATASALITGASPADASFYSLPYVSALRHCTASAYGPTLKSVVSSTAATSLYGDGLAECVVRCRLETEREATECLTAILLQELPQTETCGRRRRNPSATLDVTGAEREGFSAASHPAGVALHRSTTGASRASSRTSSARALRRLSVKEHNGVSSAPAASLAEPSAKENEAAATPFLGAAAARALCCDASALLLLRIGLCRALGWPAPVKLQLKGDGGDEAGCDEDGSAKNGSGACGLPTQLADALLSRSSYPNLLRSQRVTEPGGVSEATTNIERKSAHMFMHMTDTDLRNSTILEWVEDVLVFAHYQGFTAVQTQCVLLDSLLVLDVVDGHLVDSTDAAGHVPLEQRVTDALQQVLCAQTCLTVTRTVDTVCRYQPVTIKVPDPAQLDEIAEKQRKTTSQKALAALEAAKQSIPLISQTAMRNVEVEVEKDVTLRAVFTMPEAAAIAEYITRSVVTHKRLWGVLLAPVTEEQLPAQPTPAAAAAAPDGLHRPVVHHDICVSIENVPSIYLPPLSVFRSEALQAVVDAQRRLYEDCKAERTLQFSTDWQEPLLAIAAQELSERWVLQEAVAQVVAEDRAAALTLQQCARVERAYGLRLEDVMEFNPHVVRGAPFTASEPPAVAAAPLCARASSNKLKKNGPGGSIPSTAAAPVLSTDAAASVVLPADATFRIAEVEVRVDRIAAAVEGMDDAGAASSGASQRVGSRKR